MAFGVTIFKLQVGKERRRWGVRQDLCLDAPLALCQYVLHAYAIPRTKSLNEFDSCYRPKSPLQFIVDLGIIQSSHRPLFPLQDEDGGTRATDVSRNSQS